jgi:antitoxin CptB
MLELDLILSRFVNKELENLNIDQLASFEALLNNDDPDLYAWFMGYEQPENKDFCDILEYIRK